MSFQDIYIDPSPGQAIFAPSQCEEPNFLHLQHSLSIQISKINLNVRAIHTNIHQLGTANDSIELRKTLHDLTETTKDLVKNGSEMLKKLASIDGTSKISLQKISSDLQRSLTGFHNAQKASVERQRTVVQRVKNAANDQHCDDDSFHQVPNASPHQLQELLQPSHLSVILERAENIQVIASSINDISNVFCELGILVNQQGSLIDNVESNMYTIAANTRGAAEELSTACKHQRKTGRRAACLMFILFVVVAIIIVGILS